MFTCRNVAVHGHQKNFEILIWRISAGAPSTRLRLMEDPIDIDFGGDDGVANSLILVFTFCWYRVHNESRSFRNTEIGNFLTLAGTVWCMTVTVPQLDCRGTLTCSHQESAALLKHSIRRIMVYTCDQGGSNHFVLFNAVVFCDRRHSPSGHMDHCEHRWLQRTQGVKRPCLQLASVSDISMLSREIQTQVHKLPFKLGAHAAHSSFVDIKACKSRCTSMPRTILALASDGKVVEFQHGKKSPDRIIQTRVGVHHTSAAQLRRRQLLDLVRHDSIEMTAVGSSGHCICDARRQPYCHYRRGRHGESYGD